MKDSFTNTFQQCIFQGGRQQTTLSYDQLLPRLFHICSGPFKALASRPYDTLRFKVFVIHIDQTILMFLRFLLCQLLFLADWWSGSTVSYYCDRQVRLNSSIILEKKWEQIHQLFSKRSEIKFINYFEKQVRLYSLTQISEIKFIDYFDKQARSNSSIILKKEAKPNS